MSLSGLFGVTIGVTIVTIVTIWSHFCVLLALDILIGKKIEFSFSVIFFGQLSAHKSLFRDVQFINANPILFPCQWLLKCL